MAFSIMKKRRGSPGFNHNFFSAILLIQTEQTKHGTQLPEKQTLYPHWPITEVSRN